jgi:hypothetical protein
MSARFGDDRHGCYVCGGRTADGYCKGTDGQCCECPYFNELDSRRERQSIEAEHFADVRSDEAAIAKSEGRS